MKRFSNLYLYMAVPLYMYLVETVIIDSPRCPLLYRMSDGFGSFFPTRAHLIHSLSMNTYNLWSSSWRIHIHIRKNIGKVGLLFYYLVKVKSWQWIISRLYTFWSLLSSWQPPKRFNRQSWWRWRLVRRFVSTRYFGDGAPERYPPWQ